MRTEFLCVSVLRVASGPRVKLSSCKNALNPTVVYSTDRSKVMVLVLFLLFVLFFSMCCDASIVVTVFNSCPLCFLFNSLCCDASIFGHLQQLPILLPVFLFVTQSGTGGQGEVG